MIKNMIITRLKEKVRWLHKDELALIRDLTSRGKRVKVSIGRNVSFKPKITFLSRVAAVLIGGFSMLCVSAQAQQSITLTWDAVTNSAVRGYRFHQGTASRDYTNTIDTANITQITVPNLLSGVTYFFAVTAYTDTSMESDYSSEIS